MCVSHFLSSKFYSFSLFYSPQQCQVPNNLSDGHTESLDPKYSEILIHSNSLCDLIVLRFWSCWAIISNEFPIDHSYHIDRSSFVIELWQFQALTNNASHRFTLLTTYFEFDDHSRVTDSSPPKCLFLCHASKCFCFYLQVTPLRP